jgi:SAM-dependent methyltransferase
LVVNSDDYAMRVDRWASSAQWRIEAQELLWRCRMFPFARVLDVGTNTGRMLSLIDEMDGIPFGVEPNDAGRAIALERHANVYASVQEAIRWKGPFDIVTLSHVLGHVDDPSVMLSDCSAALKPGGVLGLLLPNPAYDRLMKPMNLYTGYKGDSTFQHSLSVQAIRRLLPKPLSISEVFYVGEKPKWLPDNLQPESFRSRLGLVIRCNRLGA